MVSFSELRHASRTLRRTPGFAVAAALTFALGVAGNTAIFSFINGIVLTDLPFPESRRIVVVYPSQVRDPNSVGLVSLLEFDLWRDRARSLESVALFRRVSSATLTGGGDPEHIQRMEVSPEFFGILKSTSILGRWMDPSEAAPSTGDVAVLTEGLWRKRFSADPRVLGTTIRLSDKLYTVIGVAASMPAFSDPDVFVPLVESAYADDGKATLFGVLGRLRAGTTTADAERELAPAVEILRRDHPKAWQGWTLRVQRLQDHLTGETRPLLYSLMGAVAFVLLIACANLAGLMLARSSARQHETAIRLSLGATRWDLLRHSLAEMAIIGTIGSAAALLLASWSLDLLKSIAPWNLPQVHQIGIDDRVLLFTLLVGLARLSQLAASFGLFEPFCGCKALKAKEGLARNAHSEDLPSFMLSENLAFCGGLVSPRHKSQERRQGSSLFQRRRESAGGWRKDDSAHGALSGRDQRSAASGLA